MQQPCPHLQRPSVSAFLYCRCPAGPAVQFKLSTHRLAPTPVHLAERVRNVPQPNTLVFSLFSILCANALRGKKAASLN
eukprot:1144908-Pelagomonas_calceolata.AAC.8